MYFRNMTIPKINYKRDILTLKDGGQVAVDWKNPKDENNEQNTIVTALILCGITGNSQTEYVRETVNELWRFGYRPVVFNYRGRGGIKLKTRRVYSAIDTEDLIEVLEHIKSKWPNSPIIGIGFSMGGILLGTFLTSQKQTENQYFITGILISVPWNILKANLYIEDSWFMRKMGKHLSFHLRNVVTENKDIIFEENNDLELSYKKISQCSSIRQFDTEFTVKIFNYSDVFDYYKDASLYNKLHLIKVPCLCLSAADDPFSYMPDIPTQKASQLNNVAILVTSGGGHVGYLDTFWPFRNNNFMLKLILQYINSITINISYNMFNKQI
ncbi:protein ABHD1-like isoform X2 [Daktulosphaira vitifoliae]|nr:protein ABHD1-like isoform X2 [Daktulosphaira vitifoliae]XP_050523516.1 protein ABHD1-like isoform X2 [Daktulosphaira vitifoliae]